MINANEIRVGNKVQLYHDIATIHYTDFKKLIDEKTNTFKDFNPIPLTLEILENIGFKNNSNTSDYCFKYGDFILGGTMKRLMPSTWGESGLEPYGKAPNYVHELQNLYFALTGHELEINL